MKLSALQYYGGKSAIAVQQTGPWIASILPNRYNVLYCEPFGGMFGVGLQRPPSKIEIYNDINQAVVAWWRAVRDHPEEFTRLVTHTPYSREEFDRAIHRVDEELPLLEKALACHIVITQGMSQGPGGNNSRKSWRVAYNARGGKARRIQTYAEQIDELTKRMRNVQLENRPAEELLERVEKYEDAIIYCDPPYRTAVTSAYGDFPLDFDRLTASLKRQQGAVAISGYEDEWDHLGWERYEKQVERFTPTRDSSRKSARTEVLWINFTPESQFDIF